MVTIDQQLFESSRAVEIRSSSRTQRTFARVHLWQKALAVILLVLVLPLFVGIAIAIFCLGGRPLFYRQRRLGIDGAAFVMLKFRTMITNAPPLTAGNIGNPPYIRIIKDPRITYFGLFLRRYYLDELPQLINVIRGEMYFVGRRPLPEDQLTANQLALTSVLAWLRVPPGITGPWQCTTNRHCLMWEEIIALDLEYQQQRSPVSDIMILGRTLIAVANGSG